MANKLNEILLDWINIHIPSRFNINPDTYRNYLGDIEEPFVQIQEWVYRKELITEYLKKPTEETIQKFLDNLNKEFEYAESVQRRAIGKVLNRFKQ